MEEKDSILGTMPMGRLVFHMSWPIMVSMLLQAVYNLVDSLYVARLGDTAFLALSYAYPVQTLLIAFCVGTGVGFSASLSRRLGAKDREQAGQTVLHGLLLYFGVWLLFLCFGLLACGRYMRFCTDTAAVAEQGTQYLTIVCGLSIGVCLQFPLERCLQSAGHPAGFMIIQGSGAVINLVLDPILIFPCHMGVAGAAWATVIGQIIGALIGVMLLWRIREELPVSIRRFSLQPALFGEMGRISLPAIVMQSLSSVMSLGLNSLLRTWSETAVWVMGAYFKIQSFVFMPIFAIGNGLVPIMGYNCGAKKRERVAGAVTAGLRMALCAAFAGTVLLCACAWPLLKYGFAAGPDALAVGVPALRMTALSFCFAAVGILCSSALQAMGRGGQSLVIALLRQVVLLLPIAWLLLAFRPQTVFLAFPTAEILGCIVALILYRKLKRERIDTL